MGAWSESPRLRKRLAKLFKKSACLQVAKKPAGKK